MAEEYFGILAPSVGKQENFPSIFLDDAAIPEGLNWMFNEGIIQRFRLRDKLFSPLLPDRILKYHLYEQRAGGSNWFQMALTKRDICHWDNANSRYQFVTPQYATGVIRVENASAEIYGGLNLDDCDDDGVAWADGSAGDVTPSRETTIHKENTAAVKLAVAAAAGVELLAYHNIPSADLSAYDAIGFWFRSSVALDAGDLQFLLDDNAACASPTETINFPIIAANTWTWVELDLADPSLCAAIVSIGIKQAVDKGAMDLYIDQIVAGDWEGQLNANDFITIGTTYSSADTWYVLSAVTDTHITLTAVYAGATAYQQAYKARQTYNGANTDVWSCATFENNFFATQGIDKIQKWTGTSQCANITGFTDVCKYLFVYERHLLAIYIVTGGPYPQRIKCCDIADDTNWSSGDATTFNVDSIYDLTGASITKGFLTLWTKKTIHRYWYIGGTLIFRGEKAVDGIGCAAPDSVISKEDGAYFYASDNKIRFWTGLSWDSISDNIFPTTKAFHPSYENYIQGFFVEEYNQLLWSCPSALSTGYLDTLLCYDLDAGQWSVCDVDISCFGAYTSETTYTWDTLPYASWDDWNWPSWDSRFGLAGSPYILAGGYDGYTYRLNFSDTDNGAAYDSYFVLSTDMMKKGGLHIRKRVTELMIFVKKRTAGTMAISVSSDDGGYVNCGAGSISLDGSAEILKVRLPCDDNGNYFKYKFSSAGFYEFLGCVFCFDVVGTR